jgi:hypothetical protein
VLNVVLTCADEPSGFAVVSRQHESTARLSRQGPQDAHGELYVSMDAQGTATYKIIDVTAGVDNSVTTDLAPLGYSSVDTSGFATQTCLSRTTTGSASLSTSLSVQDSVVSLTGELASSFSTNSKFQCVGGVDQAISTESISFQLSRAARITGSWT